MFKSTWVKVSGDQIDSVAPVVCPRLLQPFSHTFLFLLLRILVSQSSKTFHFSAIFSEGVCVCVRVGSRQERGNLEIPEDQRQAKANQPLLQLKDLLSLHTELSNVTPLNPYNSPGNIL